MRPHSDHRIRWSYTAMLLAVFAATNVAITVNAAGPADHNDHSLELTD